MKKLFITAALLIGFAMGAYAHNYHFFHVYFFGNYSDNYDDDNNDDGYYFGNGGYFSTGGYFGIGGLFQRGSTPEQQMRGWSDDGFLFFPGHASWGNWNSDPDGWTDYPPDPEVPVGGGALLLIGFGAAYAMKKRKKED